MVLSSHFVYLVEARKLLALLSGCPDPAIPGIALVESCICLPAAACEEAQSYALGPAELLLVGLGRIAPWA